MTIFVKLTNIVILLSPCTSRKTYLRQSNCCMAFPSTNVPAIDGSILLKKYRIQLFKEKISAVNQNRSTT